MQRSPIHVHVQRQRPAPTLVAEVVSGEVDDTGEATLQHALEMARAQYNSGDLRGAERTCRLVLKASPDHPQALYRLARINVRAGVPGFAIAFASRALAACPQEAKYHRVLGEGLHAIGRFTDAEASFRRALELAPGDARTCGSLASTLMALGRLTEAHTLLQQELEREPGRGNLHHSLAVLRVHMGLTTDAVASFRRAAELAPTDPGPAAGVLFARHYVPAGDLRELHSEAVAWGRRFADPLTAKAPPHQNDPAPDRRLRIGYVSADFIEHPVGRILQAVLPAHDPSQVEVFCYANRRCLGQVAARLARAAHHWRSLVGLNDDAAAELIRADGIDILVDLSGHTAENRLMTLARKPAPVQALWLGYFDTTGMASVDYIIGDSTVCPPEDEPFYVEQVARLPGSFLCYQPLESSPPVGPPPALTRGYVTFGSLNNIAKVTPDVVALWASILASVPGSRLSLKFGALADQAIRSRYLGLFAAHGVPADRVTLLGSSALGEHLGAYADIDVALDPFPYNGGVTTFDALWMGVPVVTLRGSRFVSRMGASILTGTGLSELIATTPAEYAAKAVSLGRDVDRIARYRDSTRTALAGSSLCDGAGVASALESLYRRMWRSWCERHSAA